MRILFIGDSIIKGSTGVNWMRHLAHKHPDWVIENEGMNGDTLNRIKTRLEKKLAESVSYDAIVILGGTNDILIPSFSSRGSLFRKAYGHLVRKGYQPAESIRELENTFHEIVSLVRHRTRATLILATLGCISEDPGYFLNEKRGRLNALIRQMAGCHHCVLADIAAIIDQYLSKRKTKKYLLENFLNTAYLDSLQCRWLNRADALSRKRGLYLTIDGLHLNSRGGILFMHEVERHLLAMNDPAWIRTLRARDY